MGDDAGSHHICIQMKSDFCTVTGQPDWCTSQMPCMGQEGDCPIGNWCVCQWAFARYIQMAGGCDAIVDIPCDATNMAAYKAYKQQKADPTIAAALSCLESRCSLPAQALYETDVPVGQNTSSMASSFRFLIACVFATATLSIAVAVAIRQYRACVRSDSVAQSLFVE